MGHSVASLVIFASSSGTAYPLSHSECIGNHWSTLPQHVYIKVQLMDLDFKFSVLLEVPRRGSRQFFQLAGRMCWLMPCHDSKGSKEPFPATPKLDIAWQMIINVLSPNNQDLFLALFLRITSGLTWNSLSTEPWCPIPPSALLMQLRSKLPLSTRILKKASSVLDWFGEDGARFIGNQSMAECRKPVKLVREFIIPNLSADPLTLTGASPPFVTWKSDCFDWDHPNVVGC